MQHYSEKILYRVAYTRFVPARHRCAALIYNLAWTGCTHSQTLGKVYGTLPIVQIRCQQRLNDKQMLEDDPQCTGDAYVSIRLCEPALRASALIRSELRGIPFNFTEARGFLKEREALADTVVEEDIASALLPIVCVHTSVFWLLFVTPIRDRDEEKNGCDADWIDAVVPAHWMFTQLRHALYSLLAATRNSLVVPEIENALATTDAPPSTLEPIQPSAREIYYKKKAQRLMRLWEGAQTLFERFEKLSTEILRGARANLQTASTPEAIDNVLFSYAVDCLHVLEMHLMTFCEVPAALHGKLVTPHLKPAVEGERYKRMCDTGAQEIAKIALDRRIANAACTKEEERLPEFFNDSIESSVLESVKDASDYNLKVLYPLLKGPALPSSPSK